RLTVKSKREDKPIVTLDCVCLNDVGEKILEGTSTVLAPTKKIRVEKSDVPSAVVLPKDHYRDVMKASRTLGKIKVAVVHPVQANVIEAVMEAVNEGLIDPVLIGPRKRIEAACTEFGIQSDTFTIVDTEHSHEAAAQAAILAAKGEVDAIMKGSLHTDELLAAVVSSASGLRTERRISHAYIMSIPTYHKPLIITDAAINIAPGLEEKADICRNSIDLWHVLFGQNENPKVAILSAVETVTSRMPSTIDAAALCKMSDRGQIKGGNLDGPLAFDNAINVSAAADKGIVSSVAGDADILVVPNIESGNALAKQLIFLGKSDAAGIVLGARVPIILTSRADSTRTRLLSCCVAVALSNARKNGNIK
ncbi:MAG: enoyl-CoA hydratase, partial [Micavibrio aeruginosavorus]